MTKKVLISTGGSGGHVVPAITIYNHLKNTHETFISTDGMSASISIQPETDTKIDNLISPFIMVDYLIKT